MKRAHASMELEQTYFMIGVLADIMHEKRHTWSTSQQMTSNYVCRPSQLGSSRFVQQPTTGRIVALSESKLISWFRASLLSVNTSTRSSYNDGRRGSSIAGIALCRNHTVIWILTSQIRRFCHFV